jgi:hypothetical protein
MPEKPSKLRAIIIGGLIIGVVSGTPILYFVNYCCCCGGIILGGLISLYFYRKEFTEAHIPLESSDALIIGILSGIVGAFIAVALSVLFYHVLGLGPVTERMIVSMIDWLRTQGNIPPEQMAQIEEMAQNLEKIIEAGYRLSDVLGELFVKLILCPIFSMLGGLIGYGIFVKKKSTAPQVPPVQ